jgi:predicted nucleic acid-binding protein
VKVAYVDTSCLVAIAFGESGSAVTQRALRSMDEVFSSNLLEAELGAAFAREGVQSDGGFLGGISWVLPDRPLGPEIGRVLTAGHLRGADAWHLACALFLSGDPARVSFLTLDTRQRSIAKALGFQVR